jgi:hypothetical protein
MSKGRPLLIGTNKPQLWAGICAVVLLSIFSLIGGCTSDSDNDQTTTPTTTSPDATSTLTVALPTISSSAIGISRVHIQKSFEDAGFTFDFGDIDMVGGVLFDGTGRAISVDILGPVHDVEAVELRFFVGSIYNGVHEEAIDLSITLLLLTIMPDWEEGPTWAMGHIARFGPQGDETITTTQGDKTITLYFREKVNSGLLSIEGN